jgi:hypothetical protein
LTERSIMGLEHEGREVVTLSTTKRLSGLRLVAVAISCAALTAATLGSAFAARIPPGATVTGSSGWASLVRLRHLVAETIGADADELDALNGLIDPDDHNDLLEVETPETETPETETPDNAHDDQGEVEDDQGENEQDEADDGEAAEHDDGADAEHDDGDTTEDDDGESGGD